MQPVKNSTGLPAPAGAVQKIIALLEKSRLSIGFHTCEHYHRVLSLWEAVLHQLGMGRWLEAWRGMEFGLAALTEALAILVEQATYIYQDILGAVYMELGQSDRRFGQYFTPWPVARLMAGINLGDLRPLEPGQPPLRFLEPCVGSGVLILAAVETIEERCPGMIARGEVEFYGMDIDPVCVKMARLNMALHGIGSRVERLEDLSQQQRRASERVLGYRLPASGELKAGPDLRVADMRMAETLVAPCAGQVVRQEPGEGEEALWQVAGEEQVDVPQEVAQTVSMSEPEAETVMKDLGEHTDANAVDDYNEGTSFGGLPAPSAVRRESGRSSKQQYCNEYAQGHLFPFPSDASPF
ncbi:MAG: hypothetical protein NVS4B9_42050 [Ktedonobacteraceae bacterium]